VEAEGCFSPGVGSYGVYFWVYDVAAKRLAAATMADVKIEHGLTDEGYLIPWWAWAAGDVGVHSEVCQVELETPKGRGQVVAARVRLKNTAAQTREVLVYAALRPLGPAGGAIRRIDATTQGDALLVDGATAIVAKGGSAVTQAGAAATDVIGEYAAEGKLPSHPTAESKEGDACGAVRATVRLPAGESATLDFICPVLAGRRAVGHDWDGTSGWAQADLAELNPAKGGLLQPDAGVEWYRGLDVSISFNKARDYWRDLAGRVAIRMPDERWGQAFAAIAGHVAMAMNEGAPDVAVVNYNVFNRDGVYVVNILQKAGRLDLAAAAIDYFLAHPFNGRTKVEADNPGQVLWAMGEHWRFCRDREWLGRVVAPAGKLAAMIEYCRTTPPPHYVKAHSLDFGQALPPDRQDERPAQRRQVLQPGSCDGRHPEYTDAFDLAGLCAAAVLAEAAGQKADTARWSALADKLQKQYIETFGGRLTAGYGSYCVLWPCRLLSLESGPGHDSFASVCGQKPGGWRYFALARAHQGLLAGNREAGWGTLDDHLAHEQMRGWYAFDEGGKSGSGGWSKLRTTWNGSVAMPHGWAIAELHLLLRDCLLYEDAEKLVLLAGAKEEWFRRGPGMAVENAPSHFGPVSFAYKPTDGGATLSIAGSCKPPGGFELRLPDSIRGEAGVEGKTIDRLATGGYLLPAATRRVRLRFQQSGDERECNRTSKSFGTRAVSAVPAQPIVQPICRRLDAGRALIRR
jgi:hypothetical protein